VVETRHNQELKAKGREDDLLLAWRTSGEYWKRGSHCRGDNPLTATKQRYAVEAKLQKLQAALYEMRAKVRDDARGWTQEGKVRGVTRTMKIEFKSSFHKDLKSIHHDEKLFARIKEIILLVESSNTAIFVRILHRSRIYRYFP